MEGYKYSLKPQHNNEGKSSEYTNLKTASNFVIQDTKYNF